VVYRFASCENVSLAWCFPRGGDLFDDLRFTPADAGSTVTLTAAEDPDFAQAADLLVNGVDDFVIFDAIALDADGRGSGGGFATRESNFFAGTPLEVTDMRAPFLVGGTDFQGFTLEGIGLRVNTLSFVPMEDGTEISWDVTLILSGARAPSNLGIDIMPGGEENAVNPAIRGVIAVGLFCSEDFDVLDVDVATLAFGPDGAALAHRNGPHVKDVDGDGILDLLAHFRTQETGIAFGDEEACVTGETLDGTPFEGCDSVTTVPPR
jgi:hypothetical protein